MKKFSKIFIILFLFSNLFFVENVLANKEESIIGAYAASGMGVFDIQGRRALISISSRVMPWESPEDVINNALHSWGATPIWKGRFIGTDEWTLLGHVWDENPTQYYNPGSIHTEKEPISTKKALLNSHDNWNNVKGAWIEIEYGGETDRCPSLAYECYGDNVFADGYSDVAWMNITDRHGMDTLNWLGYAVTLYDYERNKLESDIILNASSKKITGQPPIDWTGFIDPLSDYFYDITGYDRLAGVDLESVLLHENGHLLGLGHSDYSNAVMHSYYTGLNRKLSYDDITGLIYLYGEEKKIPVDITDCVIPCGFPVVPLEQPIGYSYFYDVGTRTVEIKGRGWYDGETDSHLKEDCVSVTATGEVKNIYFYNETKSWVIEVRHEIKKSKNDFYWTIYEGMSETYVNVGDFVTKGHALGLTKNNKVFYRIYRDGIQDPRPYLNYRDDYGKQHQEIINLCEQQFKQGCEKFENNCSGLSEKGLVDGKCSWVKKACLQETIKSSPEMCGVVPNVDHWICCCNERKKTTESISDNLNFLEAKLKSLTSQNETLSNSELSVIDSLIQELFGHVQAQVGQTSQKQTGSSCQGITFSRNLSLGSRGSDVKCLQSILNSNSVTQISSSGAGSLGNETEHFGSLTKSAVVKFQELYASEILHPLGLTSGTGFVGLGTRNKLNQLKI